MTSHPVKEAHQRNVRSWGFYLLGVAIAAGIAALPLIPQVRLVIGVSAFDMAVAMGGFVSITTFGFVARFQHGTRAHELFNWFETAAIQAMLLWLIYRSGRPDCFVWLLLFVHCLMLGYDAHASTAGTVIVGPLLLAVVLVATGRGIAVGVFAVVLGSICFLVYWSARGACRRVEALDAERQRLAQLLAQQEVIDERMRIARDMHDGLGADLTALDWRLRNLSAANQAPPLEAAITDLRERLARGHADIRTIVWGLREPTRSWQEVTGFLRERTSELCADRVRHTVMVEGDPQLWIDGAVAIHFVRSVLELTRNAVRHAGANEIHVTLTANTSLFARITDDGSGLPSDIITTSQGGLRNVHARATASGGRLTLETVAAGTSLALSVPTVAVPPTAIAPSPPPNPSARC